MKKHCIRRAEAVIYLHREPTLPSALPVSNWMHLQEIWPGKVGWPEARKQQSLTSLLIKTNYKQKCEFLRARVYNKPKSMPSAFTSIISRDCLTVILWLSSTSCLGKSHNQDAQNYSHMGTVRPISSTRNPGSERSEVSKGVSRAPGGDRAQFLHQLNVPMSWGIPP